MALLLYILKKYWIHITLTITVFAVITGIYLKGRKDCRSSYEAAQAKEFDDRWNKYIEDREKIENTYSKIQNHRNQKPIDDKRDSCILSSNPLEKDCLK